MKTTLFALFVALLMVGCGEQSPSSNPNESEFERKKRLAEGGDKVAQNNLGRMYDNGEGVPRDYKEAVKWYTKAAEQRLVEANFNLGHMYYDGKGVSKNYKEAVKWYTRAAEQGHAKAQHNLGILHVRHRIGMPKHYEEASKWFKKAAEQGVADAQGNLGLMYAQGQGVIKDNVTAYAWLSVAKENGHANAVEALDLAKKLMTKEQIAEGLKLAREIFKRIEANRLVIPRPPVQTP